ATTVATSRAASTAASSRIAVETTGRGRRSRATRVHPDISVCRTAKHAVHRTGCESNLIVWPPGRSLRQRSVSKHLWDLTRVHSPVSHGAALRGCMRTTHLFAQASSLSLHVLMGLWILWLASPLPQPIGQASDAMDVFVVPAAEHPQLPQLPGLNPIDTSQDDVTIRPPDGSSALSLPGFPYAFGGIATRAT